MCIAKYRSCFLFIRPTYIAVQKGLFTFLVAMVAYSNTCHLMATLKEDNAMVRIHRNLHLCLRSTSSTFQTSSPSYQSYVHIVL